MKNNQSIHPLQSIEWGEFRKKTGIKIIQSQGVQVTIHKVPYTSWTVGYVPKGPMPTLEMLDDLKRIGKEEKCIFIQLEPNVVINSHPELVSGSNFKSEQMLKLVQHDNLRPAAHPLFTKYSFILDLTKSEEEILKSMHPKTRYNIKVAQKHGVKVIEDNSDQAFEEYLKLTYETTKRQRFYAHTENYHRLMWQTLKPKIAHLFLAKYKNQVLAAWILFVYKDILYYPYGASLCLQRRCHGRDGNQGSADRETFIQKGFVFQLGAAFCPRFIFIQRPAIRSFQHFIQCGCF